MNNADGQQALTTTGSSAPQTRYNAPGKTTLTYNVGYTNTLRNMLAGLSREAQLNKLNLDAYEDWSIALLHSWAIVLDVLAFYQERIINEGYLLTATEQRSVLELARTIGYEFKPAVAAVADLALTVAPDADGQPQRVEISAEKLRLQPMAIQSTPIEGELPQIFEIAEPMVPFVARTEWNTLLPSTALTATALTADPTLLAMIYPNQTTIRLAGIRNDLQPDDTLLLIGDDAPVAQGDSAAPATNAPQTGQRWHLRKLKTVKTEPLKGYTLITWHHERYLFQLDKNLVEVLNKETQSDEPLTIALRKAFDDAGCPLANKIQKEILQAGSSWVIDENEDDTKFNRHYIVKFENQTLAVYEDIDKLTKPLYNPQFFIFRHKAKLFGYAKGAVYHAAEETAPTETAPPQAAAAVSQTKPTWTPRTLGLPGGEDGEINALVANPEGVLFAATKKDVFRLAAHAESWQPKATGLVQRNITALALSDDGALYAGSSTGGIYRSKDNGENWTPMSGDTVAPSATIKKNSADTAFNVEFAKILPKAPVQTLATDGQKLYALVDDTPFASTDMECTSWTDISGSATQAPANAPADVTATTQTILQQATPLGKPIALVLTAAKGLQWWGKDFWNFVKKFFRTQPATTPIQALAVAKQGKQTAIFMGTENGQVRLPSKINRWWVAALILVLTILWNFVAGGAVQPIPVNVQAQGKIVLAPSLVMTDPLSTTVTFTTITSTLMLDPSFVITQSMAAPVALKGRLNAFSPFVESNSLTTTTVLTATGVLTFAHLAGDGQARSTAVALATIGELGLRPGFKFRDALRAQGEMTVTGTLIVAPNGDLSGTSVATATLTIVGRVEPTTAGSLWDSADESDAESIPVNLKTQETITIAPTLVEVVPLSTMATFTSTQGTLMITPTLVITELISAPVDLKGRLSLPTQLVRTDSLTATAILTATGVLTTMSQDSQALTTTVELATSGELALRPGFKFSGTLSALGDVTVTGQLSVAPSCVVCGTQLATTTLALTGTLEATSETGGQETATSWFSAIWTQVVDLVNVAIQQSTAAMQTFWQALQDQLPDPLNSVLSWIASNILQPTLRCIVAFLQTTLLQPLFSQPSALLARLILITLVVLVIGLGWQYADHRMSKRKTVQIGQSVHALAIDAKGRIFAGSEEGLFRSPENDQQTPFLNRIERVLLRSLFTDREMEPVNAGLISLNHGKAPDVRALTFNATGNLLAGTKDGHLFRYRQYTGEPALFRVKTDMATMIKELDSGKLPGKVIKEFHNKGIVLPQPATVTVEQKETLWWVAHAGVVYLIRKEGKALNVYQDYQWDEYERSPVLTAVHTIVATTDGVLIAGKPLHEDKAEEQWFTTQLEKSLVDLDQVYADLDMADPQPGGRWLVLQPQLQPPKELVQADATPPANAPGSTNPTSSAESLDRMGTTDTTDSVTSRQYAGPLLFSIDQVASVPSKEFAQARQLSRLTIKGVDGMQPLQTPLSRFVRSKTDVLLQSQPLTLYDNRPVAGKQIRLDRYVAGLAVDQRLAVTGKVMHVRVAKGKQGQGLLLNPKDGRMETQELKPDERLVVLSYQPQQSTTAQEKNDGQTTMSTDAAQPKTQKTIWRLKRQNGVEGFLELAEEGQLIWDLPTDEDPLVSEIAIIKKVSPGLAPTVIDLQQPLQHVYDRATVTLCANVVKATHGQTVKDEILGNGTGALPNEQFNLPQKPLTFIRAETPTGYASTLKVLVQRIEWHETKSLYKLDAGSTEEATGADLSQGRSAFDKRTRSKRVYLLRQDDEQNSIVRFGDGKKGTRLPTGIEEVTAVYRVGSGREGNVPAHTINQPQTLPSAIPVVTNPVAAEGGAAPQPKDQVRHIAPLGTRTLGYIVSPTDYEDFARQFHGISSVQRSEFTIHGRKVLHLTVAGSDGKVVDKTSALINTLKNEIDKQRMSKIPEVRVASFTPLYFNVEARLLIDPNQAARREEIKETIERKMRDQFSFEKRKFGQPVAASELIALIHSVAGVEWVQALYLLRYLFSFALGDVGALDAKHIPAALRDQFEAHGHVLSTDTIVEVEQSGSKWMIVAKDKKYNLRRENGTLSAYLWPKDKGQEETKEDLLTAEIARKDLEDGKILPAEMLLLNPQKAGVTITILDASDPLAILRSE